MMARWDAQVEPEAATMPLPGAYVDGALAQAWRDTTAAGEPVADTTEEFSPDAMRINAKKTLTLLCIVPNCVEEGVQEVITFQDVRWPSGRSLRGSILHRVRVCERHFEMLVLGENVE